MSVLVLRVGYVKPDGSHMTLVDAAYFTVETIATVGYGDFNFAAQPTWLRVYAIGLMAGGAVLAAIVFAMVTQLLVSRRIERSFGQRRVGAMRGHVVVVGLGTVGIEVVEELVAAGRRVVVIDRAEAGRHYAKARALGVPVVVGDATEIAVLDAANLAGATAVAVLTSDDLVNVETGLVLRERLGARLAVGAGGVAGVRPRAGARRRGGLRVPLRAVDGGAGRPVVRRRRARAGRARHVLRRPDARSSSDGCRSPRAAGWTA